MLPEQTGGSGIMSPFAKVEYVNAMAERYQKARSRVEKSSILNEICATCGFHRKHAVRLLAKRRSGRVNAYRHAGRKPSFNKNEILKPLKKIWLAANLPCSKRLNAMIPIWLPGYEALTGRLPDDIRAKLLAISPASIDRVLKHTRLKYTRHGRSTTKPGTLLRNKIPINTNQWQEYRPGFLEADTVAHCGTSTAGQFVFTLDCVDIATSWSEQRAIWSKLETGVVTQMRSIEKALPFPLLGFDSDNGSEFINHALLKHFLSRQRPVKFTRSRAYRKDDNAHIEQKNWTHVRQWLGYDRLDNPAVVPLLNEFYQSEWRLYHNFYCSSMKLVSKERVGSKNIRKHDSPKTPYERVIASPYITDFAKNELRKIFENTNPFILWRAMQVKLKRIFKMCYKPAVGHDVVQTLGNLDCEATINSSMTVR
jgi:hypothetical protein